MKLIKEVYLSTKSFPKEELFGLVSQMRRAAVSIISNISEGAARKSTIERKRFYEIARASLVELDTQFEISFELNYLKKKETSNIDKLLNHTFALLSNLIKS
ncbi:MAG: four helix bundle protein [Melioribacteraceae bacterium]|nr:four helix bundle protein [Melioribacteraceae bacterium]